MVSELKDGNFDQSTSGEGTTLIDCRAPWCRNCEEFGATFKRAAKRHPVHRFLTLNTQSEKSSRKALEIGHVPALLVYRDGLLLFKQPGSFDESALDEIIEQAGELDTDLVRQVVAAASRDPAA